MSKENLLVLPVAPANEATPRLEDAGTETANASAASVAWLLFDQALEPAFTWRHGEKRLLQTWNDAAERLYGFARRQVLGRDPRAVLRTEQAEPGEERESARDTNVDLRGSSLAAIDAALASTGEWRGALLQRTVDGQALVIDTVMKRVALPDGRWLVLETGRDITAQRRSEQAARQAEQRLKLALSAGRTGIWEMALDGSSAHWSPETFELLALSPRTFEPTTAAFTRMIHPDDAAVLWTKVEQAVATGEDFDCEFRVTRGDGALRWLHNCAHVERDASGKPLRLVGTLRDITKQKGAEQTLLEADRRKSEFLALLSHELRNPLAPIMTAVQLMKLRGDVPAPREREVIERQALHLVRLVDDLLDVSRVARGKIELRKRRLDLSRVVANALEITSPLFEQMGHVLSVSLPPEELYVEGDETRLTQVVANLLTNAAKYTHAKGHVSISGEIEDNHVVLRVRDDGMGIASTLLPHIFETFVQGPRGPDRAEGGLGLGLSLVASLTALHGGSVEAHSQGSGFGSEFVVRLPALDPDASTRRSRPSLPDLNVQPVGTGRRILVVDDNQDAGELLALALRSASHHVELAYDPAGALAAIESFQPELAILDIGLPVMDGYQLGHELRHRLGPALHLIALTGYGQEQDKRKSAEAGFAAHLVKPVDLRSLFDEIANLPARAAR